jgi:hypothetical protein
MATDIDAMGGARRATVIQWFVLPRRDMAWPSLSLSTLRHDVFVLLRKIETRYIAEPVYFQVIL